MDTAHAPIAIASGTFLVRIDFTVNTYYMWCGACGIYSAWMV